MSDLASMGVVILAAITHATLQLGLGSLLLLYHASLGKHIRIKTRRLVSNFILGIALFIALVISTSCFLIATLSKGSLSTSYLFVIVGILIALAFCAWLFYYRIGRSTELWLPKSVVRFMNRRARVTESNIEAFSLGLLASFAEMPFALILVVVSANDILSLPQIWQVAMIICYVAIAILPLFILRVFIRKGKTVVDVQKWRTKNKTFFRFLLGLEFLVLAGFLIAFEIMGIRR